MVPESLAAKRRPKKAKKRPKKFQSPKNDLGGL